MSEVCVVCGSSNESSKIIYHHTSYFPEATVPVHKKDCHARAHNETELGFHPPEGDSQRFYKVDKDNWINIRLNILTHKRLEGLGRKGDTFDDIIGKVLDQWEGSR